jgi:hypothetical protein
MPDEELDTGADAGQGGADHSGSEGDSHEGHEDHNDTSTGADADDGSDADQGGGEDEEEEEDDSGSDDDSGGDGSDDDSSDESGEEGGGKQSHQTPAEERVKEALDKVRKIEGEFKAFREQHEVSEKPFKEINMAAVEAKINDLRAEEDALVTAGHGLQAELKRREIDSIMDAVDDNNKKKEEWESQQGNIDSEKQNVEKAEKELESAADFYQKEKKIPDDVFKKAGDVFMSMMKTDKLFERQFSELALAGRPVAAIDFAYGEAMKQMEKDSNAAEEAGKNKDKGKKKNPGGSGGGQGKDSGGPKNYSAWLDMPAKERTAWREKNPDVYKKMHRKHVDSQV